MVSVVIATRNRSKRLARALDAIEAQDLDAPFELIVVDDASDDDTQAVLANRRTGSVELRVERRTTAGGPAGARNSGLRLARAALVAFTDDDCEPSPGWLSAIVRAAGAREDVIVQGPTQPNPRETQEMGPFSRTLKVSRLGPWFPTCNVAYPRSMLQSLGGFDESLPRGEDTDLAYRALAIGARPVWAPDALVWHAVMQLGPIGKLRVAAAWGPAVEIFARHPGLRAELDWGIFWKRSHSYLLLALAGLAIGARRSPGRLLAIPYAWHFAAATGWRVPAARWLPYHALHDVTEIAALAKGSVDAGTLVL